MVLPDSNNLNSQPKKEFKEPLDTAVFTTKFVLEENKDINYVTHEAEDGAWQFFCDDDFVDYEQVARVIGLGEIIEIDDSVLELADMPEGYFAYRESRYGNWKVKKQEE